jgi:2-oxoisovalerate dehydrogenase E1 component
MFNDLSWTQVARLVLTSRRLDELEEQELAPSGEVAYQFSAKGHELAQVLLGLHLTHPQDGVSVYYRSRPLLLTLGWSVQEALASGLAREGSASGGRDAGVMFNLPSRGRATVLPTAGGVGTQYTPAAGWAQAIRYYREVLEQEEWQGAIAVACGGDGSVASNGFWAALNLATTRNLPFLFFIEDNGFAISVRSPLQTPGGNIAANLRSYGNLYVLDADGCEPLEAAQAIREAVAYVRQGHGPCLLRLRLVRLMGHTFVDDQAYKSAAEREEEAKRDPLLRLRETFPDLNWQNLEKEVEAEIRTALEKVRLAPDPDPNTACHGVFAPMEPVPERLPETQGPRLSLIEAVRRTLEQEMEQNPRLLVFGEDVGVKGGVHGATARMQKRFGEKRVFDTSLSEEGIMGSAVGLALAGLFPVPEIQFRKYADPATEQINDAGTLRWRTAGHFSVPMVVRIPVGFGKKNADPWHSVSGEAVFAHTIGWMIAYPSNAADAVGLLRAALRGKNPVLFLEHRALLDSPEARRPWPGDEYLLPFGQAACLQEGNSLTVVTWGAMVYRVFEAVQDLHGIEILDLRTIIPWDRERVLDSVRKTGKCLVVHEDTFTVGFGAEILATIASEAFEFLDAPLRRLSMPDCPIPYNAGLREAVLPSPQRIRLAIEELLRY